jgi:hypothetical protein
MTRTAANATRAPETDWKVESLRLTTFHAAALLANAQGWWRGLTGSDPESVVSKPRGGERAEVGRYEGWPLALQVQQQPEGRVDWVAGGFAEAAENLEAVPRLVDRLPLFINPLKQWLQATCPETNRLAFGSVLRLDVPSREEGYRKLSNYLDFDLNPEAYDFLYRINRKRQSAVVDGLRVNRLSNWSVGFQQHRIVTIHFDSGAMEAEQERLAYQCRLELDINTSPDFAGPLPHERLVALLDEIREFSLQIVREGDIP